MNKGAKLTQTVLATIQRNSTFRHELAAEARLHEDLGIDSLTLLSVVSEIEEALGITFPEAAFAHEHMSTVGDIVGLAEKYFEQKP